MRLFFTDSTWFLMKILCSWCLASRCPWKRRPDDISSSLALRHKFSCNADSFSISILCRASAVFLSTCWNYSAQSSFIFWEITFYCDASFSYPWFSLASYYLALIIWVTIFLLFYNICFIVFWWWTFCSWIFALSYLFSF
jgi:hypothetical protein